MTEELNRMLQEDEDDFLDSLSGRNSDHGKWYVQIKTPSGRTVNYELTKYNLCSALTINDIEKLAKRIFNEKYRYCKWDRDHPKIDVENIILSHLVKYIQLEVDKLKEYDSRKPHTIAFWALLQDDLVIEEFPYSKLEDAKKAQQNIFESTGIVHRIEMRKRSTKT